MRTIDLGPEYGEVFLTWLKPIEVCNGEVIKEITYSLKWIRPIGIEIVGNKVVWILNQNSN